MELSFKNIPFSSKAQLAVYYKGHRLQKTYIPDLLVYGEIVIELKAVKELDSAHEAQLLNYMHITNKALGYLINFGTPKSVQWRRFILKEYIPQDSNA